MAAHKVYHPSRAPPRQEKSRNGSARQERSRATAMPRKPLYPPKPILGQMARQKVWQPQQSRLAGAAAVKQAQKLTARHAFPQMASGRHASGSGRLNEDDLGGPELCERCATIVRPQQREPVTSLCQVRLLRQGSDASSTLPGRCCCLYAHGRPWAATGRLTQEMRTGALANGELAFLCKRSTCATMANRCLDLRKRCLWGGMCTATTGCTGSLIVHLHEKKNDA
jgi:hypothetical protein